MSGGLKLARTERELNWGSSGRQHTARAGAWGRDNVLPCIHSNSHYLTLEKNSMQVVGVIADWLSWLSKRVTPGEAKATATER
jgi:hypothetical protein